MSLSETTISSPIQNNGLTKSDETDSEMENRMSVDVPMYAIYADNHSSNGGIYGENFLIPNVEVTKYTEEDKEEFDKFTKKTNRESITVDYDVYNNEEKQGDLVYIEDIAHTSMKNQKLKSSLKTVSTKASPPKARVSFSMELEIQEHQKLLKKQKSTCCGCILS